MAIDQIKFLPLSIIIFIVVFVREIPHHTSAKESVMFKGVSFSNGNTSGLRFYLVDWLDKQEPLFIYLHKVQ